MVEYRFGVDIIKTVKILFNNIHLTCGGLNNAVKLEKGVPQGGILSPTLFDYYIDNLA